MVYRIRTIPRGQNWGGKQEDRGAWWTVTWPPVPHPHLRCQQPAPPRASALHWDLLTHCQHRDHRPPCAHSEDTTCILNAADLRAQSFRNVATVTPFRRLSLSHEAVTVTLNTGWGSGLYSTDPGGLCLHPGSFPRVMLCILGTTLQSARGCRVKLSPRRAGSEVQGRGGWPTSGPNCGHFTHVRAFIFLTCPGLGSRCPRGEGTAGLASERTRNG